MANTIPSGGDDVAARVAQRTMAGREAGYSAEVRLLLDAGREVMRRNGTSQRAKVADIVVTAGLSNDTFYRHFPSKDALVAAILEDGTVRLRSYLAHQMAKESEPVAQVHRWVDGVLAQAVEEGVAATTLAVLWNAGSAGDRLSSSASSTPLADLLVQPFVALGSEHAPLHASLAGHAVVGALADHLWARTRPQASDVEELCAYVVRALG